MRTFVLAIAFSYALLAGAQQPGQTIPAGSNWQDVQVLPAGTSIHVDASGHSRICDLKSVDAESLTCTHHKDYVFSRTEIKSIKLVRRSRSTPLGIAIGATTGAVAGAAAYNNSWWFSRGGIAAIAAIPLAAVGGVVGYTTDFTASTVYRAP